MISNLLMNPGIIIDNHLMREIHGSCERTSNPNPKNRIGEPNKASINPGVKMSRLIATLPITSLSSLSYSDGQSSLSNVHP